MSACSAGTMNLLPPDAVEGQQHPRVPSCPQRRVGFGEDCTHRSLSQLNAVEELTACCSSKRAGDKLARDRAGEKHHLLATEPGLSG